MTSKQARKQRPKKDESGKERRWNKAGVIIGAASLIFTYLGVAATIHWVPFSGCSSNCGGTAQASTASPAPRTTQTSRAQLLAISCQALTDSAGKEASALGDLKDSITVDNPSSRVISHTSGYASAYKQVKAQLENLAQAEGRYKSYGGKITVDPYLDGDLNQLPQDLSNLHAAVQDRRYPQ